MDLLRELLLKKEQEVLVEEDKKKVENLKNILSHDDIFFQIDINTALGILYFLGIPKEKMKEFYFELISPQNYLKTNKPYITIS